MHQRWVALRLWKMHSSHQKRSRQPEEPQNCPTIIIAISAYCHLLTNQLCPDVRVGHTHWPTTFGSHTPLHTASMTTNAEDSSRHIGNWGSFKGLAWARFSTHPIFEVANKYLEVLQTFWHRFVRIHFRVPKGQKSTNPLIIALVFFAILTISEQKTDSFQSGPERHPGEPE